MLFNNYLSIINITIKWSRCEATMQ